MRCSATPYNQLASFHPTYPSPLPFYAARLRLYSVASQLQEYFTDHHLAQLCISIVSGSIASSCCRQPLQPGLSAKRHNWSPSTCRQLAASPSQSITATPDNGSYQLTLQRPLLLPDGSPGYGRPTEQPSITRTAQCSLSRIRLPARHGIHAPSARRIGITRPRGRARL